MDQLSGSAASLEPTIIRAAGLREPFRILHLTDLHLCECDERNAAEMDAVVERKIAFPDALERFEEAIEWSRTVPFDLLVMTGDQIDSPTEANLDCLAQQLGKLQKPWVMTFGNHDWLDPRDSVWQRFSRLDIRGHWWQRFSNLFHQPFEVMSKRIKGVRLIFIDNSDYQITAAQLRATQQALEDGEDCLFFMHIPMSIESLRPKTIEVWTESILMADQHLVGEFAANLATLKFCQLMKTHPRARAIFSGHIHFDHRDAFGERRYQFVSPPCFKGGRRLVEVVKT
jgi:DNA repair exonuclease SbcCD nuclease subunit